MGKKCDTPRVAVNPNGGRLLFADVGSGGGGGEVGSDIPACEWLIVRWAKRLIPPNVAVKSKWWWCAVYISWLVIVVLVMMVLVVEMVLEGVVVFEVQENTGYFGDHWLAVLAERRYHNRQPWQLYPRQGVEAILVVNNATMVDVKKKQFGKILREVCLVIQIYSNDQIRGVLGFCWLAEWLVFCLVYYWVAMLIGELLGLLFL